MMKTPIYPIGALEAAPSCHCSILAELPDGDLYAAWFAGAFEKARDVSIWGSRKHIASSKWESPKVIATTPNHSEGSPVLYVDLDNNLHLYYQTMHHGRIIGAGWSVCTIKHQVSHDLGQTWGPWEFMRRRWFRMLRCKPLRLSTGRVILPFHREMFQYQSGFFINKDPNLRFKWKRVGRLKVPGGCLEPSITQTPGGIILCALRTARAKRVYFSESQDEGNSWTKPRASKIPNPNSQTDLLCLRNGHLLLACNPVESGRNELSIIRSTDGGQSWDLEGRFIVEEELGQEFSYPCLLQTTDDSIQMTYTFKRKTINHTIFTEEELFK